MVFPQILFQTRREAEHFADRVRGEAGALQIARVEGGGVGKGLAEVLRDARRLLLAPLAQRRVDGAVPDAFDVRRRLAVPYQDENRSRIHGERKITRFPSLSRPAAGVGGRGKWGRAAPSQGG